MLFNRTSSYVTIGLLLLLLAAPTYGQGAGGFQIFAPADMSTYGGDPKPNEGYFFQFHGLYWSITPPTVSPIGAPGTRTVYYGIHPTGPGDTQSDVRIQSNTLDTSLFDNQFRVGNRIDFGRVRNRNGWFVSIFQLRDQLQDHTAESADMVFNDPAFGPFGERLLYGNVNNDETPPDEVNWYKPPVFRDLPVTFYNVFLEKRIDTWGVEANYLHRFLTRRAGGTFELFLGARYFEFNEHFWVHTGADPGGHTVPSYLAGSYWDTDAENHIIGPQIGLRWFKKQGRWMISTEGRFMAGLNRQNFHQQVNMGPNLNPGPDTLGRYTPFQPKTMAPTAATHSAFANEWSPAFELRIEGRYQITRSISFHAGWSGMWIDGIARATSVTDYTVPALGLNLANNREQVFLNGLTIGFDVNR